MRFPEVIEAVTFPNLDEVLVRRRAHRGGMTVLERLPRRADSAAPLHTLMTSALEQSRWTVTSPVFPLPGRHTEFGVKVEVQARTEQQAAEAIVPLTEHHREALTDEAVRFYQQLGEPTEGLESYSTAAAGTLIWDARMLPIRFTGHRTCRGDLVRAHTVAATGLWEPVTDRPSVLTDHALTARVLWQLICELSD